MKVSPERPFSRSGDEPYPRGNVDAFEREVEERTGGRAFFWWAESLVRRLQKRDTRRLLSQFFWQRLPVFWGGGLPENDDKPYNARIGPRAAAAAGAELAESPSAALPDSRSGWSSQRARALAPGLKLELQLAASSGLELGLELGLERARKPLARAGLEI